MGTKRKRSLVIVGALTTRRLTRSGPITARYRVKSVPSCHYDYVGRQVEHHFLLGRTLFGLRAHIRCGGPLLHAARCWGLAGGWWAPPRGGENHLDVNPAR